MSIRNPVWILFIVSIIAILGYYGYVSWDLVTASFIFYILSLGLWVEIDEIRMNEGLKAIVEVKIERVENLISKALKAIESEDRIKEKLSLKRKQVIEWLCKF